MMNSSPVRSDKRCGRRHERISDGLVRRPPPSSGGGNVELMEATAAAEKQLL
jgi:hypothetical protein